jgi:deoxyadenosine/deoxycytidine kinase
LKWFEEFQENIPEEQIVYLRTNPKTAYSRIIERGRVGENIPFEYIEKCHNYHENWLINNTYTSRTIVLDANVDHKKEPEVIESWLKTIINSAGL